MADGFSLDAEGAEVLKRLQVERMRAELRSLRTEKWMSYLAVGATTVFAISTVAALLVAAVRIIASHHP